MKLKILSEDRYNKVTGKNTTFKKMFNKINTGLSEGELQFIKIYPEYIEVYIGEKTK